MLTAICRNTNTIRRSIPISIQIDTTRNHILVFPLRTINIIQYIHHRAALHKWTIIHYVCTSVMMFSLPTVSQFTRIYVNRWQHAQALVLLTENVRMLASNEATEYSRIDSPHSSFCKWRSYYGQWWAGRDRGTRGTAGLHPLQRYSGKPLRGTRKRFEQNCTRKVRNALASFPGLHAQLL